MDEIIKGYNNEKELITSKMAGMIDQNCYLYEDFKSRLEKIDDILISLIK